MIIQRCIDLEDFRLAVLFELFRRQSLLLQSSNKNPLGKNEDVIRENWKSDKHGMKLWIQKEKDEIFDQIRDIVDFESDLISTSITSNDYQQYVQTRPDIISNRSLHYLQSLFDIEKVDEILPTLNQVYLRHQEFLQFVEIAKRLLGKGKDAADSIVLTEVIERLQYNK